MSPPPSTPPHWPAHPADDATGNLPATAAHALDHSWLPLTQAWRSGPPETGFKPGWARISWSPTELRYDAVFLGSAPRNRARRLNERAWEMGDVGEIFVQPAGRTDYGEIHVTPENVRLQLSWSVDGLADVRTGTRRLEEFLVDRPDWVRSESHVGPDSWIMQVIIPAATLGVPALAAGQTFRTAVCRYHYPAPAAQPIVSSTAAFSVAGFHRPQEWHRLTLAGRP